jgi:hypothetical protein
MEELKRDRLRVSCQQQKKKMDRAEKNAAELALFFEEAGKLACATPLYDLIEDMKELKKLEQRRHAKSMRELVDMEKKIHGKAMG